MPAADINPSAGVPEGDVIQFHLSLRHEYEERDSWNIIVLK
jgi:hypothetical protein